MNDATSTSSYERLINRDPVFSTGTFAADPTFTATNDAGKLLDVRFEYSDQLWPWSGYLALYLRVDKAGATTTATAEGQVC